ncbi:hypothetical protein EWM64_g2516 [Hericium alpestre]|uniref:Uncharacterized protein n=1 Tax=Hericium alpestre TaxID=135208 RepID=A0A4Z0A398_9AGAM|nr:hypothetical protein EWM64_g2516 [Hericium alpestre]
MAPKPTTDSPVMQFLKTPPAEYRHTDTSSFLQVAAIDEQSTTSKWAHDCLRGVVLRKTQWDWLLEGQYKKFERFVNKQESPVPVVQDIPFEYPRNEADVGCDKLKASLAKAVLTVYLGSPSKLRSCFRYGVSVRSGLPVQPYVPRQRP